MKEKDANFTGADTRNGMTAVVAVKHPDPIFEGQTKTKLASADATEAAFTVTGDELQRYFDRNLEILKAVISCAEKAAKIRKAEEDVYKRQHSIRGLLVKRSRRRPLTAETRVRFSDRS